MVKLPKCHILVTKHNFNELKGIFSYFYLILRYLHIHYNIIFCTKHLSSLIYASHVFYSLSYIVQLSFFRKYFHWFLNLVLTDFCIRYIVNSYVLPIFYLQKIINTI